MKAPIENPPIKAADSDREAFRTHARETLAQLSKTGDLPTLPAAAAAALAAARQPFADIERLSRIVESDVGLAARVLRIANSVAFGRRVPKKTLHDAIVSVGLRGTCDILVGACARRVYEAAGSRVADLWNHALTAGLSAQELARALGLAEPASVFLPGLFHDVGSVVLFAADPTGVEIIEDLVTTGRGERITLEREWYGFDHALAGGMLTQDWGFAPEQADAISRHHDPPEEDGGTASLAAVLAAADSVACALGFSLPGEGEPAIHAQDLGLSPEVEAICAQEVRSSFKLHKNLLS